MMKKFLLAVLLAGALGGCVSNPLALSSNVSSTEVPRDGLGPKFGIVADSQLQTRANFARIDGYRGVVEDKVSGNVSIRPPALDWAARSMLLHDLQMMQREQVDAVFYLGDGANNGCYDEFAAGYADSTEPHFNDRGILRILADFRRSAGIPVFFVIGNHDILGAGSTGDTSLRERFCANVDAPKPSLMKSDVIAFVDRFNRESAQLSDAWTYLSSLDASRIETDCDGDDSFQHRRWGCYLAGRLDFSATDGTIQFLLLDTTDFAGVSPSEFAGIQQEGLRGAMSFGDRAEEQSPSQTAWFDANASDRVNVRIALSHYNLMKLSKNLEFLRLSRKVQRFADIFLDNEDPKAAIQDDAYLISAHSHIPQPMVEPVTLKLECGTIFCKPFGARVRFTELNVGSTTDYSSYAIVSRVVEGTDGRHELRYQRVEVDQVICDPIYAEMENFRFDGRFLGEHDRGWKAIGIDAQDPFSYRHFDFADLEVLWANLEDFASGDVQRATCVGTYAAAIEAGEALGARTSSR